ncbi:hypothetical protein FE257_004332 [Aspergillus nanangensis]|uniref:Nudix hydrolase domain-containing protein n=1 Tax=Aspergillus nanangensis TaxID=2582783 RepID=A0AAD4GMF0_ASPNN|nr:hypothetical protein FE257_004332 [Aspergillus nanangensis]
MASFTSPPHLTDFTLPLPAFSATRPQLKAVVVGGLIFSRTQPSEETPTAEPRVLLLQRAATDSFPGRWEGPGGLSEHTDASVLAGTAREVFEESGLHVRNVVDLVAVDEWTHAKSGQIGKAAKFTFLVEVEEARVVGWEDGIVLDPSEHQAFVWATESEVRQSVEGKDTRFSFVGMNGENLLTAFQLVKSKGAR